MPRNFVSRGGYIVNVDNGKVSFKKFMRDVTEIYDLSEIASVDVIRSPYDVPFNFLFWKTERTVAIRFKSGKSVKVKRLPKTEAEELAALLS